MRVPYSCEAVRPVQVLWLTQAPVMLRLLKVSELPHVMQATCKLGFFERRDEELRRWEAVGFDYFLAAVVS